VPGHLPGVPIAQLGLRRRPAADEGVQPVVAERDGGLGGVVDAQRLEVEAGGAQRLGRDRS
jgi:hypothetical protein